MTVNEVYKLVQYLANKHQGGYISPEEFNRVINMAQDQYLFDLNSKTNFPVSNRLTMQMGKGMTQPTIENLSKFIVETSISAPSGVANKPNDFFRMLAMRTSAGNMIRRVEADRWYAWVNSAIDTPSASNPIFTEENDQYNFYPVSVSNAVLVYVRKPATIQWSYTISGGRPVYNPSPSVDPEWDEYQMYDIILRALNIVGINLRDGELMRASQVVKQEVEQ